MNNAAVRHIQKKERWGWLLFSGIVGILTGVVVLVAPWVATIVLASFLWASVGFWAIFTGVLEISAAVRLRREIKGEIWLALSGLLSIILGAIVLWYIFYPSGRVIRGRRLAVGFPCGSLWRHAFVLELESSQNAPGVRACQTKIYGYEHTSIHASIEMTSKESYMQIQYSYRAIDKEFHEPWQRALGNVIEHALKPLLDKHTKDSARLQIVLDRDKIKRQFLASGYMHLPGKKIVSVTASHDELTPLAQMLAQSLFRQAKKHFDRLHAQDQIKRKARRERLRELKVRIAAKPASAAHEAEVTRMPLLSKLEAVARRELAYLRAVGDLPRDYPTLRDVVDEAIVRAKVEWQSVPGEKEAYTGLLKHLFAVLDNEVASSRQFGEFVSLDAPVEPDAQDVAEAMVEEEIFEFYQHDDTLKLADIFAGSQHPDVATIAEQEELIDRSSEFAFAFDLLKDMPRLWRRIFLLIRVDGLNASSVSEILLIPSKEDAVQRWLMQAEAFIAAHLEEAGVSKNGNDWLQGVDWSALSVTRSEAASLWSKEANHEE